MFQYVEIPPLDFTTVFLRVKPVKHFLRELFKVNILREENQENPQHCLQIKFTVSGRNVFKARPEQHCVNVYITPRTCSTLKEKVLSLLQTINSFLILFRPGF